MGEVRSATAEEVTDDFTKQEDEEMWRMRQKTLLRRSTLIHSDEEDDTQGNEDDVFMSDGLPVKVTKKVSANYNQNKKTKATNFDLAATSPSQYPNTANQSKRPHQLSEDDNYRSLSALDQLTLFQKLKGLETDEVPPLLSAPSSTIFSRRPQTAGRLNRARSKGRRSQSIFGQGSLEQET